MCTEDIPVFVSSWSCLCEDENLICSFSNYSFFLSLGTGSPLAVILGVVLPVVVLIGIVGAWVYYAYTHPASPSGIWLMEVGTGSVLTA